MLGELGISIASQGEVVLDCVTGGHSELLKRAGSGSVCAN